MNTGAELALWMADAEMREAAIDLALPWRSGSLVGAALLALAWSPPARADDIGISFDLAPAPTSAPAAIAAVSSPSSTVDFDLPAPPVAVGEAENAVASRDASAPASASFRGSIASGGAGGSIAPAPPATEAPLPPPPPPQISNAELFAGGSDSLVAKAVGSAEGTRTPDGQITRAYYGHVDPGNGVWNLGSFSYQHGADSPAAADVKQLRRLQTQLATLQAQAAAKGLTLTLAETLNAIDLANQSPRAALSRGGYIDRLAQAREMGLQGADAVLWARTRAFLDPDTNRWNAPGLGNNVHSITRDQDRRRRAIEQAIEAYQRQ